MPVSPHQLLRSAVTACLLLTPALAQGSAPAAAPREPVMQAAPAQNTPTLSVYKVVNVTVNGKATETRVGVVSTKPGDLLERVITLTSPGTARPARLRLSVPKNTEYVPGSARTTLGRLEFRAGGNDFSVTPMKTLTVTTGGMKSTRLVPVPENEYTDVSAAFPATSPGTVITFTHRIVVKEPAMNKFILTAALALLAAPAALAAGAPMSYQHRAFLLSSNVKNSSQTHVLIAISPVAGRPGLVHVRSHAARRTGLLRHRTPLSLSQWTDFAATQRKLAPPNSLVSLAKKHIQDFQAQGVVTRDCTHKGQQWVTWKNDATAHQAVVQASEQALEGPVETPDPTFARTATNPSELASIRDGLTPGFSSVESSMLTAARFATEIPNSRLYARRAFANKTRPSTQNA